MKNIYLYSLILLVFFHSCVQVTSSKNNLPPKARFSVSQKEGTLGDDFIFDASFSDDDFDEALTYFWQYYSRYGKLIDSASNAIDTVAFLDTGYYFINLTVFDSDSLSDTCEDTIHVTPYLAPKIALVDTCIDFGPVECDYIITKQLTLQNTGDDTLKISAVYFTGIGKAAFSSSFERQISLPTDSSKNLLIYFAPDEIGDYSAAIHINSNDPLQPARRIELWGQGFDDLYDIEFVNLPEDSIDFSVVKTGHDSTISLIMKNIGKEERKIQAAYITGSNAFSCDFTSEFVINPQQEKTLIVTYSPNDTLRHNATLTIMSDDPFSEQKKIFLKGKGRQSIPKLKLPDLIDSTIDFEKVSVSKTEMIPLKILNTGDEKLTITAIYISGSDRQDFDCDFSEEITLSKGETHFCKIYFSPTANRNYTALLKIHSNDVYYPIKNIDLIGTGARSRLEITNPVAGELDFGNVEVGRDSAISVVLTNSGDGILTIVDAYIRGENAPAFRCDFDSEITISSNHTTTDITVSFSPSAIMDYTGEIVINTDELTGNRCVLPVFGKGYQDMAAVIDRDSLNFGPVVIGESKTEQVNVSNNSENPLKILYIYFSDNESYQSDFSSEITVNSGENIDIDVTYAPQEVWPLTAEYFYIFTNDPAEPTKEIYLQGEGIFPARIECADTVDFEEVEIGSNKTIRLYLKNVGNGRLDNINLFLDSQYFSFKIDTPMDLLVGASAEVELYFDPKNETEEKSAQLEISADNYPLIKSVFLKGKGRSH